jgi:uncharacterized protein (TIGR03435 family)
MKRSDDQTAGDAGGRVALPAYGMIAQRKSMRDLAGILMRWTDRPVIDMTGLTGLYDFSLDWRPLDASQASDPMAALDALQQIGLKTESRKAIVEYLIIDPAERVPVELI